MPLNPCKFIHPSLPTQFSSASLLLLFPPSHSPTTLFNPSSKANTPLPEFAQGKVDPHEAGKKGGQTSGTGAGSDDSSAATGGDYKPTEHGGLKKDGSVDGRVKQ
jgi:hypothetical protein